MVQGVGWRVLGMSRTQEAGRRSPQPGQTRARRYFEEVSRPPASAITGVDRHLGHPAPRPDLPAVLLREGDTRRPNYRRERQRTDEHLLPEILAGLEEKGRRCEQYWLGTDHMILRSPGHQPAVGWLAEPRANGRIEAQRQPDRPVKVESHPTACDRGAPRHLHPMVAVGLHRVEAARLTSSSLVVSGGSGRSSPVPCDGSDIGCRVSIGGGLAPLTRRCHGRCSSPPHASPVRTRAHCAKSAVRSGPGWG